MNPKEMFELFVHVLRIGNRAVHQAQQENRKMNLPNVYGKEDRLYWELPDGTITSQKPEMFRK
jgi:hypothetical protein